MAHTPHSGCMYLFRGGGGAMGEEAVRSEREGFVAGLRESDLCVLSTQ